GTGFVDTASVTVTVQGVNDLPTAVDDVASLDEDTSTNIDVLSNDGDLDGDSLSVASVVASSGEVFINPDNTLPYTPDANFNGNVIISYTISDGRGRPASATLAVPVHSSNA
ncbi:Ig-like domain-containing protein, partial [Pseudoalteromonas spongiae]|uniref:Ig-like domain-containing protein n=1 Tax=Pseudoalteromonas spongiae TaxID=298657 RepID=UPI001286D3E4